MQAPPGGPVDETPPEIVMVTPDSGAVGLAGVDRIEIVFSEKVATSPAPRFMNLYPSLEIKKTGWKGRRRAIIEFYEPLPADTVIVVEIPRGHADRHNVESTLSRRYPLCTGSEMPGGRIRGDLVYNDAPAAGAVVELYDVPPDTLEYFRQDPLRRTETDSTGVFAFDWLYAPGGPYLMRAFVDANGDLRPAESEAQRLLPIEISLTDSLPVADAGTFVLYDPRAPGRVFAILDTLAESTAPLFAWPLAIADSDTGFVPVHARTSPPGQAALAPGDTACLDPAGPGLLRVVVFADLDGDSLLSALPDSTAVPDTVLWRWEPYTTLDSLEVDPGLETFTVLPTPGDSLRPCTIDPPHPRPAQSDSTSAPPDSLGAPPPDHRSGDRPPPRGGTP